MTALRRLTAQLVVDGTAISGVVRDEAGEDAPFSGWLELIALLQAEDGEREPAPERA